MDDGGGLFIYSGVASKLALYLTALLAAGIALSVAGGVIAAASARKWLVSAGWLALGAVVIAGLRACLTALAHYQAGRYQQAGELFARIAKVKVPQ